VKKLNYDLGKTTNTVAGHSQMLEKVFDPQGKKRKTERYEKALMSFLSSIT
jgi:hypothetical protein